MSLFWAKEADLGFICPEMNNLFICKNHKIFMNLITHFFSPIVLLVVYDKYMQSKKKKPLNNSAYLVFAFAGILPDILHPHLTNALRSSFSHSVWFLFVIFLAYLIFRKKDKNNYLLLLFFGVFLHLLLDVLDGGFYKCENCGRIYVCR